MVLLGTHQKNLNLNLQIKRTLKDSMLLRQQLSRRKIGDFTLRSPERELKQFTMSICKGTTAKGTPCKMKCVNDYCRYHINQRSIDFYPAHIPGETPSPVEILDGVVKVHNPLHLKVEIARVLWKHSDVYVPNALDYSPGTNILFERRLSFFKTIEILKLNNQIVLESSQWDGIIETAISKMSALQLDNFSLDNYIENFKRKCLKRYRYETQKKFYSFYFYHVDGLCFDVIEKILSFV
jgi:hypothetical protein